MQLKPIVGNLIICKHFVVVVVSLCGVMMMLAVQGEIELRSSSS